MSNPQTGERDGCLGRWVSRGEFMPCTGSVDYNAPKICATGQNKGRIGYYCTKLDSLGRKHHAKQEHIPALIRRGEDILRQSNSLPHDYISILDPSMSPSTGSQTPASTAPVSLTSSSQVATGSRHRGGRVNDDSQPCSNQSCTTNLPRNKTCRRGACRPCCIQYGFDHPTLQNTCGVTGHRTKDSDQPNPRIGRVILPGDLEYGIPPNYPDDPSGRASGDGSTSDGASGNLDALGDDGAIEPRVMRADDDNNDGSEEIMTDLSAGTSRPAHLQTSATSSAPAVLVTSRTFPPSQRHPPALSSQNTVAAAPSQRNLSSGSSQRARAPAQFSDRGFSGLDPRHQTAAERGDPPRRPTRSTLGAGQRRDLTPSGNHIMLDVARSGRQLRSTVPKGSTNRAQRSLAIHCI
ncbi:hypothetical protein DL93DRAFT_2096928 [Clavulina sp. PMI_390]|nr:hypothetical protein DL93DRAFT_2096928 [Clavulina sp. PMI_390]